jgi:hypothetical protein
MDGEYFIAEQQAMLCGVLDRSAPGAGHSASETAAQALEEPNL